MRPILLFKMRGGHFIFTDFLTDPRLSKNSSKSLYIRINCCKRLQYLVDDGKEYSRYFTGTAQTFWILFFRRYWRIQFSNKGYLSFILKLFFIPWIIHISNDWNYFSTKRNLMEKKHYIPIGIITLSVEVKVGYCNLPIKNYHYPKDNRLMDYSTV